MDVSEVSSQLALYKWMRFSYRSNWHFSSN